MNDDFLNRIRKEPRPEFLRTLKERLDRIDGRKPTPIARTRPMRTLFAGVLIGASALALASLALKVDFAGVCGMLSRVMPLGDRHRDDEARRDGENQGGGSNESAPSGRGSRGLRSPWTIASRPGQENPTAPARGATAARSGAVGSSGAQSTTVNSAPASFVVGTSNVNAPRSALKIVATPEIEPEIRSLSERLAHNGGPYGPLKMPDLSVADSTAALAALCRGSGLDDTDIVGVSRRVTPAEAQSCVKANGSAPVEILIGYQAVVLLRNKLNGAPNMSSGAVFLALAARVPNPLAAPRLLVPNHFGAWNEINPALGYDFIDVIGPPLRSPAGRGFVSTIMKAGCHEIPWLAAKEQTEPALYESTCTSMRSDAPHYEEVEYGPSRTPNTSVTSRLTTNPAAIGVVGYLTYEALSKTGPDVQVETMGGVVLGGAIDGIEPTRESIAAGTYPGSRALYLYVNREHMRFLRDQLQYFVRTFGFPDSMSNDASLVSLPWEVREGIRNQALGKLDGAGNR